MTGRFRAQSLVALAADHMARLLPYYAAFLVIACLLHASVAMVYLSPDAEKVWSGWCILGKANDCDRDSPCSFPTNSSLFVTPDSECFITLLPGAYRNVSLTSSVFRKGQRLAIFMNGTVSHLTLSITGIEQVRLDQATGDLPSKLVDSHIIASPFPSNAYSATRLDIKNILLVDTIFSAVGSQSLPTWLFLTLTNATMSFTDDFVPKMPELADIGENAASFRAINADAPLDSVFNIRVSNTSNDRLQGAVELTLTERSTLILPKSRNLGVLRSTNLAVRSVLLSRYSGIYHSRHIVSASPSGGTTLTLSYFAEITSFTTVFDGEIDDESWTADDRNNILTKGSGNLISGKSIPMDRSPKSTTSTNGDSEAITTQVSEYGSLQTSGQQSCVGFNISSQSVVAWLSITCPTGTITPDASKSACPFSVSNSQLFDNQICLANGQSSNDSATTATPYFENVMYYMDAPESFLKLGSGTLEASNLTILNRTIGEFSSHSNAQIISDSSDTTSIDAPSNSSTAPSAPAASSPSGAFIIEGAPIFIPTSSITTNVIYLTENSTLTIPNLSLQSDSIVSVFESSQLIAHELLTDQEGPYTWNIHAGTFFRDMGVGKSRGVVNLISPTRINLFPSPEVAEGTASIWSSNSYLIVYVDAYLSKFGVKTMMQWTEKTVGTNQLPIPGRVYSMGPIFKQTFLTSKFPLGDSFGSYNEFTLSAKQDIENQLSTSLTFSAIPPPPPETTPVVSSPPSWNTPSNDCYGSIYFAGNASSSSLFSCRSRKWVYMGSSGLGSSVLLVNDTLVIESTGDEATVLSLASFAFTPSGSILLNGALIRLELSMCYPTNYASIDGNPTKALSDQTLKIDLSSTWPSVSSWDFVSQSADCTTRGKDIPHVLLNSPAGPTGKCQVKKIVYPSTTPTRLLTIDFVMDRSKCNAIIGIIIGVSIGAAIILIVVGIIVFRRCRKTSSEYTRIN